VPNYLSRFAESGCHVSRDARYLFPHTLDFHVFSLHAERWALTAARSSRSTSVVLIDSFNFGSIKQQSI
jgi:hypothetical protein